MALVKQETRRREIIDHEPRTQTAQDRTSVYAEPGKVSVINAHYLTGINRHNQKRWWRWENSNVNTTYLTKDGRVAGRTKMGNRFISSVDFNSPNDPEYKSIFDEYIGKPVTFNTVFPIAQHWGINGQGVIPRGLVGAMREDDLPSMVRKTFGKTRYRRDLVRATGNADPQAIGLAKNFVGLVPIDWIVNFLRINEAGEERLRLHTFDRWIPIRPWLFTMDPRSYRNLLSERLYGRTATTITDTMMMLQRNREIGPPTGRYRSWTELHDWLENTIYGARDWQPIRPVGRAIRQNRVYTPPQPREDIPLSELGKKLDGYTDGTYRIVIPKKVSELTEWGTYMRNCIGGYGYRVASDNSPVTLGAIYEGDKLLVNFEVTANVLGQFLGRFNQTPGRELCLKFEPIFSNLGVDVRQYWGKVDGAGNEW